MAQVMLWETDAEGKVDITMPKTLIKRLENFLDMRITNEIYKATAFISDTTLRTKIREFLLKIFKTSGIARMAAVDRLISETIGNAGQAKQISDAISYLTDTSGYKDNPFLLVVKASAAVTECRLVSGPGYCENAVILLFDVTRRLTEYSVNPENSKLKTDRLETAQINKQISIMFGQLGDDQDAVDREWIARFMNMSVEERDQFEEGDIIEIVPPEVQTMGTPSVASKQKTRLDDDWKEKQKLERQTDGIGSASPPSDPNADKYFVDRKQTLDIIGATERVKKRGKNKGFQDAYRPFDASIPLHRQNRLELVSKVGAGMHIAGEFLKYVGARRRMNDIADYYARRESIEIRIARQQRRVAPLKPQKILAALKDLRIAISMAKNAPDREKIQAAMRALELLLEESNALWKDRK